MCNLCDEYDVCEYDGLRTSDDYQKFFFGTTMLLLPHKISTDTLQNVASVFVCVLKDNHWMSFDTFVFFNDAFYAVKKDCPNFKLEDVDGLYKLV